ncbi:hypothetical protein HMPREF0972_01739 [Actinomyces sp. oral taxon 848 str. F0332]|nr:hypothetical protein HMPREF0972_01739 [Actinomyces sp. oral taxon 848 str. F0332]
MDTGRSRWPLHRHPDLTPPPSALSASTRKSLINRRGRDRLGTPIDCRKMPFRFGRGG